MLRAYKNIGIRAVLILSVLVFLLYAFALRAQVLEGTFATNSGTGALELKIDSRTVYNGVIQPSLSWSLKNLVPGADKFFNFGDVKPGDQGQNTISLHFKNNASYACLDFKNLTDAENGVNEPEAIVDPNGVLGGELSSELEFFGWLDDGDNTFEVGERALFGTSTQSGSSTLNNTTYALADATHGSPFPVNQTKYVGILWCAGDLQVNLATAAVNCNGEVMGNESQTDSMSVDVSIRAVASAQQPNFSCTKPHTPPPPPTDACEIEGHKYDRDGKPLSGWTIGLSKTITHNKGVDIYDLATDVTDADGYYCLRWDGESRTIRGKSTYKSGPYNFTYQVYEKLKDDWKISSIEKGPNVPSLVVVPKGDIKKDGKYVGVQIGTQNGYIFADAEYHVDFYNQKTNDKYEPVAWRQSYKDKAYTSLKGPIAKALEDLKKKFKS